MKVLQRSQNTILHFRASSNPNQKCHLYSGRYCLLMVRIIPSQYQRKHTWQWRRLSNHPTNLCRLRTSWMWRCYCSWTTSMLPQQFQNPVVAVAQRHQTGARTMMKMRVRGLDAVPKTPTGYANKLENIKGHTVKYNSLCPSIVILSKKSTNRKRSRSKRLILTMNFNFLSKL